VEPWHLGVAINKYLFFWTCS